MYTYFCFIGHYEEVYKNQFALAQYFKKLDDNWLSNHFYECCFQTAKNIKSDGGRKEAEAHANLAVVAEEHGKKIIRKYPKIKIDTVLCEFM